LLKAPCINCTERHPSCHSHCERYLSYVKEKDALHQKIQKQKYDHEQFMYVVTRKRKK
jgi:hypothetical protein